MSTLSPQAQAVLDAVLLRCMVLDHRSATPEGHAAAIAETALRAAADQVVPRELGLPEQAPMQGHIRQDQRGKTRRDLLAIAAELDPGDGVEVGG